MKTLKEKMQEISRLITNKFVPMSYHISIYELILENQKDIQKMIKSYNKVNKLKIKSGEQIIYNGKAYTVISVLVGWSLDGNKVDNVDLRVKDFNGTEIEILYSEYNKIKKVV